MRDIRIAAAQFEHRDGDKTYNLGRIRDLARRAAAQGAEIVCFHECSITAYTFLQTLSRDELDALAEPVPDGPSVGALTGIARETGAVIMAGRIGWQKGKVVILFTRLYPIAQKGGASPKGGRCTFPWPIGAKR
jgi:predicted amidohydrolase